MMKNKFLNILLILTLFSSGIVCCCGAGKSSTVKLTKMSCHSSSPEGVRQSKNCDCPKDLAKVYGELKDRVLSFNYSSGNLFSVMNALAALTHLKENSFIHPARFKEKDALIPLYLKNHTLRV